MTTEKIRENVAIDKKKKSAYVIYEWPPLVLRLCHLFSPIQAKGSLEKTCGNSS